MSNLILRPGLPLDIRFKTDAVVATWWVHLVVSEQIVRTWTGKTSDAAADEAVIPAADLQSGRMILWQLVLFGSVLNDIPYQIRVEYLQDSAKVAHDTENGTLKQRSTALLSQSRELEIAP